MTPEAAWAVRELLRAGVPVNNQSVLMRGINDTVETQLALSHALLRVRVRPYYLFHADEVRDTEHLRAPAETGIKVIEGMRGHTSGLGVPTFVVDVPGGGGNIPLQPNYILSYSEDEVILRNYEWQIFRYRNARPEDTGTRAPASATNGKVVPLLNDGAPVGNSKGWAATCNVGCPYFVGRTGVAPRGGGKHSGLLPQCKYRPTR